MSCLKPQQKLGSGRCTAVGRKLHDCEMVGSNLARCEIGFFIYILSDISKVSFITSLKEVYPNNLGASKSVNQSKMFT